MRLRPERPKYARVITPFQGWSKDGCRLPGATRFALVPGFHISRRWREAKQSASSWLSYLASLTLTLRGQERFHFFRRELREFSECGAQRCVVCLVHLAAHDVRSQIGDRSSFKEEPQRQRNIERIAHTMRHLSR